MNSTARNKSSLELLAILVASLVIFLAILGHRDIVTSHEGRVAQTARVMAASGWPWNASPVHVTGYAESNEAQSLKPKRLPDDRDTVNPWLFPVINNQIRMQKPPLPYWMTAMLFRAFGVNEFNARLAPALLNAIAVLLIWDLARVILGRRAALPAAIVWITTRFIVDELRKSIADPYLAFFVLLTLWGWWRCGRGRNILAWISLALGMLAKGPVIFVFVVPAMILAKLLLRRRSGSPRWTAHAIGAILFLAIALPWYLIVLRHAPDVWRIWWYESGGEVSGLNAEKARPWWLYIATSFNIALPWTPVWIAGIVLTVTRLRARGMCAPRNRRRLFALAWYAITVLFFSLLKVKKDAYLLPVMPAQALIVAEALVMIRATFARRVRNAAELSAVLMAMQSVIALGFAGGIVFALRRIEIAPDLLCGVALLAAIVSILAIARRHFQNWLVAIASAYAMLLIALIGFYLADHDNRRSPRGFDAALVEYLKSNDVPLVIKAIPEEASFYLPLDLPDARDESHVLVVIDHSPKDPPVDAKLLSEVVGGEAVQGFQRIKLVTEASVDRYQLFEVIVNRNRA